MPNPKKKNRKRKNKRTASGTTASTVPKASDNNNAFLYGDLLLELILDAVPASDLIPLRCLNRRARDFIDCRIFKHVTLKTDRDCMTRSIPVITQTETRLPLPALTPLSPDESVHLIIEYLDKHTTVLDLENIDYRTQELLGNGTTHLNNLLAVRLKSDHEGYHTYDLFESFGALTAVVFPSFYPFLKWKRTHMSTIPPGGATKLVQHLAYAVDWRGPVLLGGEECHSPDIKEEVWIMTHAKIDVHYGHFGLWDDGVYDTNDELHGLLLEHIAFRLNSGVELTIVGCEKVRDWGYTLFGVVYDDIQGPVDGKNTMTAIRDSLPVGKYAKRHLHFKTWKAYAATLSPEELEIEKLPPSYLKRWRELKAEKYKGEPDPTAVYDSESELDLDEIDSSEYSELLRQLFQEAVIDGMS